MTGSKLAELMIDTNMMRMVAKAARRMSRRVEDQEEYIQDAWVRIAKCPDDSSIEHLENEARRGIKAAQMRRLREKWGYHKKPPENVAGNSIGGPINRLKYIELGRGRYLKRDHEHIKKDNGGAVSPPFHIIRVVSSEAITSKV